MTTAIKLTVSISSTNANLIRNLSQADKGTYFANILNKALSTPVVTAPAAATTSAVAPGASAASGAPQPPPVSYVVDVTSDISATNVTTWTKMTVAVQATYLATAITANPPSATNTKTAGAASH